MAFQDAIKELQDFDINELDFENVGSWPIAIKVIVWSLAFVLVLVGGYYYDIKDKQRQLEVVSKKELELRKEFEKKAHKAANLEAYRKQMEEMEESFGALVSQLPSETEVPGLLEDITNKGVENGLEIESIQLEPEKIQEFYVELPIKIVVKGTYHDFGTFVSGIANLPRIVTLHDFEISKPDESREERPSGLLVMNITAKTYRYKEEEEGV